MKTITVLGILLKCKGKPVTSRQIMDLLVQLPEMEPSKVIYKELGWDDKKITAEVIRDYAKDVNVMLHRLKKVGFVSTKPIKKCDKKIGATDQKMLYTLTKAGIKELEKIKQNNLCK